MTLDRSQIDDILSPVDEKENARRAENVRARFWKTARKAAGSVPFMDEVVAAYYCAMDNNTSLRVRGTLLAALAYFVLPFDLIPDFIFGLGFTDDIAVLTAALTAVRSSISPAHRLAAQETIAEWRAGREDPS